MRTRDDVQSIRSHLLGDGRPLARRGTHMPAPAHLPVGHRLAADPTHGGQTCQRHPYAVTTEDEATVRHPQRPKSGGRGRRLLLIGLGLLLAALLGAGGYFLARDLVEYMAVPHGFTTRIDIASPYANGDAVT